MSKSLIRPLVEGLKAYVPGEQIIVDGLVRLNTNENPYSPAPAVLEKIKECVDGRLRRYPNPGANGLREKLAAMHGCKKENILVGNGSDEVLEMAIRTFVEPLGMERSLGALGQYGAIFLAELQSLPGSGGFSGSGAQSGTVNV